MNIKKDYIKIIVTAGVLLLLRLVIYPPGHRWAREHVDYITAVDDHPLNCISCHLYTKKTGFIPKLINADYHSPLNLALSADAGKLFVTAEESNTLLVVDTEKRKVTDRIKVGERPHSIILDEPGINAYVSNQWSDYVSVIDLNEMRVVGTLKTGNGPAGLALGSDEKYLYVVNSYSSDISVIELDSGTESRRLRAGNNPTGIRMSPDGKLLYITSRRSINVPYGDPVVC
ncbi:MAG: beta-propeller fold lactonase family protein, partial [Bacteroidales bacterium]|nr:beta-propeller fold lactonase family protein [Bacteroidales bacterium]